MTATTIKILTCTANMGNAEPTASSMNCWVPEGGACSKVTSLSEATKASLEEGTFDVIAIGMQEATWKIKDKDKDLTAPSKEAEEDEDLDDDDLDEQILAQSELFDMADESDDDDEDDDDNNNIEAQESFDKEGKKKKKLSFRTVAKKGKSVAKKGKKVGKAAGKAAAKSAQKAVEGTGKVAVKSTKIVAKGAKAVAKGQATQLAVEMSTEALLKQPDSDYLRGLLGETLGTDYHLLKEYQRGQMRLYIYVKKILVEEVSGVDLKAENTGIGNVLANKGGIVCTFTIRKTRISFLTAHLAAHEGDKYYKARNDNLRDILRGATVGPKHLSGLDASLMSHHMFVMGDLNYRTRLPGMENMETEEQVKKVFEIVEKKEWEKLFSYDELSAGIRKKEMLVQFETPPCNFNPTFKMLREEGFKHKAQRVPSYTDRVLHTSAPGLSATLTPLAYEPCPGFITSDHKPMRGAYAITTCSSGKTKSNPDGEAELTKPVSMVFKDMKCTGLPPADVDGFADPYIMFMCDPVSLIEDDRDVDAQKRKPSFDGKKWPVTAYRKKNLNPDWPEEVRLLIQATSTAEMEGAMLYLNVWDYDLNSSDDLMCSMVLNLKDLTKLEEGLEEKEIKINQPLLKYGMEQGHIQGTIIVSRGNVNNRSEGPRRKSKRGLLAKIGRKLSAVRLTSIGNNR